MKLICIGRNYRKHAEEMKQAVPTDPLFFMKPETALIKAGMPFFYPAFSHEVHYEAELVIRITRTGKNIQAHFAHRYYDSVAVGFDFTARDLQQECIRAGKPWEISKAFDGSAAHSAFVPLQELKQPGDIHFSLKKNEHVVQQGNSADMVFDFDTLIAYVSRYITLKIGDLLFTGTPAGVGPLAVQDKLELFLEDRSVYTLAVK